MEVRQELELGKKLERWKKLSDTHMRVKHGYLKQYF